MSWNSAWGPVVDFNVCGVSSAVHFDHRYDVLLALKELVLACDEESFAFERVNAHQSYLQALMGQQIDFADYIRTTQMIRPLPFPSSHIDTTRGNLVREPIALGVGPDQSVYDQLAELDPPLPLAAVEKMFEAMLEEHRRALAAVVGTDLNFSLSIVPVVVDEYWSYWVDGAGGRFRLRLNQRKASFSRAECLQFTFHELLAHCGQAQAWQRSIDQGGRSSEVLRPDDGPYPRAVHVRRARTGPAATDSVIDILGPDPARKDTPHALRTAREQ